MRIERTYESDTLPTPVVINVNNAGTATTLIAASEAEPLEAGGYLVTEISDPAPRKIHYGTLTEAVIALRYTLGAEIALNRLPDDDDEKIQYLAFVEEAKAAARQAVFAAGLAIEEASQTN